MIDDLERKPIAGAIEFIDNLNAKKIPFVLITNNTKHKSDEFLGYLQTLGFTLPKEKYLDPLMVLKDIVKEKEVAVFGSDEFKGAIAALGYEISQNPKAFFVGVSQNYGNEDYAQMIELSLAGAAPVAMHATSTYAKDGKRYPGVGAILEMIKYASGRDYVVVGKPSRDFYEEALRKIQIQNPTIGFKDITVISDDARGDLVGAKKLGMESVLVLSGKAKTATEGTAGLSGTQMPDLIIKSVKEYGERL